MSGDCEMEEVPTTVISGERCHLGEGPTYDAATDTAWWFDIVERRLFEAREAGLSSDANRLFSPPSSFLEAWESL